MLKKLINLFIINLLLFGGIPTSFAQGQIFKYKISVFNKSAKELVGIVAGGEFIELKLGSGKVKEIIIRSSASKEELKNIQLVFEGQSPLNKTTSIDENKKSFLLNSKGKFKHEIGIDEDGDLFFGESSGGVIFTLSPDKGVGPNPKLITLSANQGGMAANTVITEKLSKLPHLLLISASANGEIHSPRGFFFGYSKTGIDPVPLSTISEYYEDLGLYGLEDATDRSEFESEVLKSALGTSELYFALSFNPKNGGFEVFAIGVDEPKKIAEVDSPFYIGYLPYRDDEGNDFMKIVIAERDPSNYLKGLNEGNQALTLGAEHRLFSMSGLLRTQTINKNLGFGLLKIAMAQITGGSEQQEVVEEIVEVSEDSLICPDIPELTAPTVELPADVTGATTGVTTPTSAPTPPTSGGGAPREKEGGLLDQFFGEAERALGEGGFLFGGQVTFGGSKGAEATFGLLGAGRAIGVDPSKFDVNEGVGFEDGKLQIFGIDVIGGGMPGTGSEKQESKTPGFECGKRDFDRVYDEYLKDKQERQSIVPEPRTIPTESGRTTETGGGSLRRFTDPKFGQLPERELPQLPQQSVTTPLRPLIQTPSSGFQLIR